MQGPSPDEVALVEGGKQLGFEFVHRTQDGVKIKMLGVEATFQILNIMDFTSDRGRMSVIARCTFISSCLPTALIPVHPSHLLSSLSDHMLDPFTQTSSPHIKRCASAFNLALQAEESGLQTQTLAECT